MPGRFHTSPLAAVVTLLALSVLAHPAKAQQREAIASDLGERLADEVVRPTVAPFSEATSELVATMHDLCEAPTALHLSEARDQYADTVSAWGQLSILRFGPLMTENRFERIFFWPDPRGVTLRKVQDFLVQQDESALSTAALRDKSIALQGLPALEFVLHGSGADDLAREQGGYRCRYGATVAGNIAEMAGEIEAGWDTDMDFAISFADPSSDSNPYRSPQEVAGEVIKALGTGLQFASNAQIKPALGGTLDEANGNRAPLRRSDLSFALLSAQIEGLSNLLAATGWQEVPESAVSTVADSVAFDLDRAAETIASIERPAADAFESEEDWDRLRYVTVALDFANRTVNEKLAGVLGLTMGFNALDGD